MRRNKNPVKRLIGNTNKTSDVRKSTTIPNESNVMHSYTIEVRQGFSAYDHLAPIGISGTFPTLKAARKALEEGRKAQGNCESLCRQVRCDIIRDDGKRFDNE